MKKERLSFLILFVEIAAIVLLHSAKSRHEAGYSKTDNSRKTTIAAPYQLKTLSLSKLDK
jgi:hypothetical protein